MTDGPQFSTGPVLHIEDGAFEGKEGRELLI
jgi:hypothetical protein